MNPVGKALLKTGAFVKESLLGRSPFHWIQEGIRGLESGVNPFTPVKWNMQNPEYLKLIEAGGIHPGIEQNMNVFTEGSKGGGSYTLRTELSSVLADTSIA